MANTQSYRKATTVPCPQCGAVRELFLYGAWERERAFARKCWACRIGKPGDHFRKRGVADGRGDRPFPAAPTTAAPGTPEKLAVLEDRAKDGVWLFHPADARFAGDRRPLAYLAAAS